MGNKFISAAGDNPLLKARPPAPSAIFRGNCETPDGDTVHLEDIKSSFAHAALGISAHLRENILRQERHPPHSGGIGPCGTAAHEQ